MRGFKIIITPKIGKDGEVEKFVSDYYKIIKLILSSKVVYDIECKWDLRGDTHLKELVQKANERINKDK